MNFLKKWFSKDELIAAVEANDYSQVSSLLIAGKKPDVIDKAGNTPVSLAITAKNHEMLQLLIKYRVSLNKIKKAYWHPVLLVAEIGDIVMM